MHLFFCFSSIWFAKVGSVGRSAKKKKNERIWPERSMTRNESVFLKSYLKVQVYQELIQYLLSVKVFIN